MTRIGLVDYGMGNRRSVQKALEHVGAQVAVTSDADVLRDCDGLVVPGVGAFPEAMRRLQISAVPGVSNAARTSFHAATAVRGRRRSVINSFAELLRPFVRGMSL